MTELSLEKALTTFGWVFGQIGKFYTFWAFLSRFPGGWGACLLVDLLVWSSVVLCFAVLAGDWQPADRKRPRVASDHIVIARIHGELLRLHILGTPPSWIRILLSVISSSGEFLHFYIFTLPIFVVAVKFRLLLWRPGTAWWCASFCGVGAMPLLWAHNGVHRHRHAQMPPCSKPHQYIQLCNCILSICGLQFNHLVKHHTAVININTHLKVQYESCCIVQEGAHTLRFEVYPGNRIDVLLDINLRCRITDLRMGVKLRFIMLLFCQIFSSTTACKWCKCKPTG